MFLYQFHGIRVRSGISLDLPLRKKKTTRTLKKLDITETTQSPYPLHGEVWVDPCRYADGRPVARLFLSDGNPIIDTPDSGAFTILPEAVHYFRRGDAAAPVPYLLGRVFALWMELSGFPLLHGSCFETGVGAAGILGDSGAGKSTLSAALVNRGVRLLTDDLIPLHLTDGEVLIDPGIPMSRIWPDTGRHLVPNFDQAARIHPQGSKRKILDNGSGGARFLDEVRPLKDLFVLERGDSDCPLMVSTTAPASALMALVANSYRPELVQTLGLQGDRMAVMAQVLATVRVHTLRYPTGFHHLEGVCELIAQTSAQARPVEDRSG